MPKPEADPVDPDQPLGQPLGQAQGQPLAQPLGEAQGQLPAQPSAQALARFDLHGLRHASFWDLPGVAPLGPDALPPEVIAAPGPVPPAPPGTPWIEEARLLSPSRLVLEAPDMRLLVEDGARVTLDAPGMADDLARLMIGYAAGTILLHQRGRMPLHAAAAAGADGAVLLLGDGGAGKSTMAAMLARRGLHLVGDDMIALAVGEEEGAPSGAVGLHRSMRTAKLWRDSVEATGAAQGTSALAGLEKSVRAWADPGAATAFPAPLRAIIHLGWLHPRDAAPELTRLAPLHALPLLRAAIARASLEGPMGLRARYLARAARIVSHVPVFTLRRARDFARTDAALDLVAACVAGPGRP
jgi:hypothetical protein